MGTGLVTLVACGDVMPGRGVDQVLPHPGDPELREDYASDANAYIRLAERANGPISRPAGFSWPWGDALPVLEEAAPDVRVINLETSVTGSADFAPGKAVHYRMNPDNLPCVAAIVPDVCALANNHVLDFGERGLRETLASLAGAGLAAAGAGRDLAEARQPVALRLPDGGRMLVFSCGAACSGIPPGWAATATRPGVDLVPSLSPATAEGISGHEEYRDDLRLLYFASLAPGTGELAALTMVPMQARNMRLRHASAADGRWLGATLDRISRGFGSRIEQRPDGRLTLRR